MKNSYNFKVKDFHGLSTPEELKKMWDELKLYEDETKMNVIWNYTKPSQLKPGFNIVNILYDPENPDETGHYVLITVNNNTKPKEVEYFNPVSNHTLDDKDKLKDLLKYFAKDAKGGPYDVNVNLNGTQSETSENCGYHCLTRAFNYYNDASKKMWPKAKVETVYTTNIETRKKYKNDDEVIDDFIKDVYKGKGIKKVPEELYGGADSGDPQEDLLKTVRGIYYGLKYGFDRTTPARKKKKVSSGYDFGSEARLAKTYGSGLSNYYNEPTSYTRLRDIVEK